MVFQWVTVFSGEIGCTRCVVTFGRLPRTLDTIYHHTGNASQEVALA